MIKIYLETGKKTTSEYVFIETWLRVLGLDKSYQIECVNGKITAAYPNAKGEVLNTIAVN